MGEGGHNFSTYIEIFKVKVKFQLLKLYSKWKWTPYHLWIMKKCSHWSRKWKNFALFSNFRIYNFYYGACKISKVCTCTIYQVFLSERKLAISCSNIGRKITGENTCCVVVGTSLFEKIIVLFCFAFSK